MKRIRKIEIENSRAYYDRQEFILNKGENLLLYGETAVASHRYSSLSMTLFRAFIVM